MTEQTVTETPASQADPSNEQVSSSPEPQEQGFTEAQLAQLVDIINKRVQSTTDKRNQNIKNELTGITKTIAEIRKYQETYGYTEQQAIKEMERDREIAELLDSRNSEDEPQGSGFDSVAFADSILSGAGVDPKSDSAREFVNSLIGKDPIDMVGELTKFAVGKATSPQADPGDIIPPGGPTASQNNIEKLDAELERLQKLPVTQANMKARKDITEKMKQFD